MQISTFSSASADPNLPCKAHFLEMENSKHFFVISQYYSARGSNRLKIHRLIRQWTWSKNYFFI